MYQMDIIHFSEISTTEIHRKGGIYQCFFVHLISWQFLVLLIQIDTHNDSSMIGYGVRASRANYIKRGKGNLSADRVA